MKNVLNTSIRLMPLLEFDLKMKFSLLFILTTLFTMQAFDTHGQDKISINLEAVTVEEFITEIENKTDYSFIYKVKDVDIKRKISVKAENESLLNVLEQVFNNTKTTFNILEKRIFLVTTKKTIEKGNDNNIKTQQNIKGKVMDTEGLPLFGANIIEKGTSNGVITNMDGEFEIAVTNQDAVLVVSYIGYISKEITVGEQTNLKIVLQEDTQQLEAVVITALGRVEKKKKLSYATQRVTTEQSNRARGGDITRQLGGRVAGLNIISNGSSGGLVSSSRLTIRGENSLQMGKNEPLIIVDGVPISNNQDATGGSFRPGFSDGDLPTDFGDGLSDINPDDIESIDVLRGANAAALYGSRAANGVLIITTKSGKGKELEVVINSGITFSRIFNTWDMQETYGGGFNGEYNEFTGNNWGPAYDPNLLIPQTGSPDFPNASPFIKRFEFDDFFEIGYTYNNNVAVQGSNDKSNYRFSYTDQRRTGTVPNTDYDRRNFSTKATVRLNDKFKIDFAGNFTNSFSDNTPLQGFNPQSVMYPFIWGHYNFDLDWFKDYWQPGQEFVQQNWPISYANNPWLIANENLNAFNRNRIFGNIKTSYKLNEKWDVFFRAGIDYYDERRTAQRPSGQGQFNEGMYREQNIRFKETNIDFLASYNDDLSEDMSLSVSFGGNTLEQTNNRSTIEGRRLAIPGLFSLANIENQLRPEQFDSKRRIHSLYSTATLGWKDALFLELTARNDWSSTLPTNNNSYFYPSVGVSSVLSEFIDLPKFINFWKLRTNFAQVGNDTDPFIINPAFALGQAPGSVQNQSFIPLLDLEPERTNSFEIGTEFRFLNNRLNFEFNYYNNTTENQILQIPISEASGFNAQLINAGKINNEGFELLLSGSPIKTKDFQWSLTGNWSRNVGRVEELSNGLDTFILGGTDVNGGNVQARVGGLMGDIYGFGYLRSPEGDIIYRNGLAQRGNELIKLGNYNPDWIAGLSSTMSYKFINASILMDYRHGGELVSRTTALLYRTGLAAETEFRPAGGIVGNGVVAQPDGSFTPNTTNVSLQDYWRSLKGDESNIEANIYDATFFKIREISLGVDFGELIDTNTIFKDLEVNLFVTNLFIWTKSDDLRHIDPENVAINGGLLVPGFEYTSLPPNRNYGMNIKLKF